MFLSVTVESQNNATLGGISVCPTVIDVEFLFFPGVIGPEWLEDQVEVTVAIEIRYAACSEKMFVQHRSL